MRDILSKLSPPEGAVTKERRIGRGVGSGLGKTSGRGQKGQKARSKGNINKLHFQGGQTPMQRRLPKRGFTNIFRVEYVVVNLERLVELGVSEITPEVLKKAHITKRKSDRIKVLGEGELKTALTIQAHKFSKSAQEKITGAGGKFEVLA